MSNKTISIVVTACMLTSASIEAGAEKDSLLHIHLPREVVIENDIPNLGQVSIIRGEQSLIDKAGKIVLGRISVPGQTIVVDRLAVLSRLACNGITASKVTLTGAEKIAIKQKHRIIKGSELVELARSFLGKNLPDGSVCQPYPIGIPKDLVLPGMCKNVRLSPNLVKSNLPNSGGNQAKVRIAVLADDKEISTREVSFRLKYNCRRAVTLVDIPAGTVIGPENVKAESVLSNYPEPANWTLPYGLVAKRRLPANIVVHPTMVGPVEPRIILLKRNQHVIIRVDRFGLVVTAIGKTMQEGKADEYIKVRNVDSQRVILAKVNRDGTVEPVF